LRRAAAAGAALLLSACAAPSGTPGAASPGVAPAPVRTASVSLVNPGFESMKPGIDGNPEGWYIYQHGGDLSYIVTLDSGEKHGGDQSARIDNMGPEIYGTLSQIVRSPQVGGRTIRFAAWLRTRGVTGSRWAKGAGLQLTVYAAGAVVGGTDFKRTAFAGTTDWTRYEVSVVAPPNADRVDVGISLTGPGTVWVDDAELELLPPPPR
jgi:hypothetical protein